MNRRVTLRLGLVALVASALAACGDDDGTSPITTSERRRVIVAETAAAEVVPTTAPVPTAPASPDSIAAPLVVDGPWFAPGRASPAADYLGPPMQKLLERTTDAGVTVRVYRQPGENGGYGPSGRGDGLGWHPAPWCGPSASVRITMQWGEAIGVGSSAINESPFGGVSSQIMIGGYAEDAPFTVLLVQGGPDMESVDVAFADGTTDSADAVDGLAVVAAPTAPPYDQLSWSETPARLGLDYHLTLHRGGETVEVASADLPVPTEADYQRDCSPPTELPEPGEQPADPAAAEQAVRDTFAAVFDRTGRDEGDRSWLAHLDDDTGVEAAIEQVFAGVYGEAAGTSRHEFGDVVFTSPTEAWFTYDLVANGNRFDRRFGLAVEHDGVWKLSRGVICQDMALGGGRCEPPIGPLYPPIPS